MKKFIILRGIPASGKSTWARKYIEKHPDSSIILSMDSIRNMLGIYWIQSREPLVKDLFNTCLNKIMTSFYDYDIIIDNTNLNEYVVKELIEDARLYKYEVKEVIFKVPLKICQIRDSNRDKHVGTEVIERFYMRYCHNNGDRIVPLTKNPIIVKNRNYDL